MIDKFRFHKKSPVDAEIIQQKERQDVERIERNEKVIAESRRINAMLAEILPSLGDVMADMVGKPIHDV